MSEITQPIKNCDLSKYYLITILVLIYTVHLYLVFEDKNSDIIGYAIFILITLIRISDINNIRLTTKSNIATASLVFMSLLLFVEYIILILYLYSQIKDNNIIDQKSVIISFIVFSFINILSAIVILTYKIKQTSIHDNYKYIIISFLIIGFSILYLVNHIPIVQSLIDGKPVVKTIDISNFIISLFDFF